MPAETTNGAASGPTSRWSDEEKIALLLSVIKSSAGGKITWSTVEVPAGRTIGSSQKQYEALLKSAALVQMTSGDAITPTKKRGTGGAKKNNSTEDETNGSPPPPKKRGRKPKKTEPVVEDENDDEEREAKKVKLEAEEDLIGEDIAEFGAEKEGIEV